jgi:HEAT repeat protein
MLLEQLFQTLAGESKQAAHAELLALSGLGGEDLRVFKANWPKLAAERRREIASRLFDLAEDNPEFNFDAVFTFSLKDPDEVVRQKAIMGLWECEERSVMTTLVSLLKCDPSPAVRAAAAQGLGKFLDLIHDNKLSPRDEDRIRDALLAALSGAGPLDVRRRALESLASVVFPDIVRFIHDAYKSQEPKMRASAIYAMGRNGDPQWVPTIIKELSSPIPEMRYEAAMACGALGEPSMVPKLVQLLRDDDIQVRLAAIVALGEIGSPAAKKALQQEAKSADETIREAAENALASLEFQEDPLSLRASL